jgi:predicted metal-binding membrane protein
MMIAMMLPSAAPMILLHAVVGRKSKTWQGGTPWRTAAFTAGYLAACAFFSATAAGLQWGLWCQPRSAL